MPQPLICPECGVTFTPTHHRATFCTPAHKQAFHNVQKARGQVAMPFVMAWRTGKRGKTDNSAYGLQQLAALADRWAAEDRACGRRSDLVVTRKRVECWSACDLDAA